MGGDQLEAVKNYGVCGWTRFWVCGWPGRVLFFLGGSFFLGPVRVPRRVEPGAVVSDFCHRATRGGKWGARGRVSSDIRALAGGEDTPTRRLSWSIRGNMNNLGIP